MKIVTIVGARPQFVKAAIVSRQLARLHEVRECLVHTGQHYDERMSAIFFEQLSIPEPAYNLRVGSGSHAVQTAAMLTGVEGVLLDERPDVVLVYGDTNSTLAGALAATKLGVPVAHVEAGLRSYNRRMPEEVNRVVADQLSDILFCPTRDSVDCLAKEGIRENVHLVGDVMYDAAMHFSAAGERFMDSPACRMAQGERYALVTCHRAENTDDPKRLRNIIAGIGLVARDLPVLFPVHPRTRGILKRLAIPLPHGVELLEPVSYLEMLVLERRAALILTDSGGVQKEAFFFQTPCVTMRDETEWRETVDAGANILAGADAERIANAARTQLTRQNPIADPTPYYGEGRASEAIARILAAFQARAHSSDASPEIASPVLEMRSK